MATKDITDGQVVKAIMDSLADPSTDACEILMSRTVECEKVCMAALERAYQRGLIDCGVRVSRGWVTEKGLDIIKQENHDES